MTTRLLINRVSSFSYGEVQFKREYAKAKAELAKLRKKDKSNKKEQE